MSSLAAGRPMLGLFTAIVRLVSKKNTFLPLYEQFLTFFEVGLYFLEVGLLDSGLALSKVSASSRLNLYWSSFAFLFKLERFLKFQFLHLFHRRFCRSIVSTLNLTCSVIEQFLKGGY